jgi:hypothetical protein
VIAFTVDSSFATTVLVLVLGGGFATTIVALIKVRPEAGQIVVKTAQGAVLVQTDVIISLENENKRLRARQAEQDDENKALRDRLTKLESVVVNMREALADCLERNPSARDRIDD